MLTRALAFCVLSSLPLTGQNPYPVLRINELLIDPVGPNAGAQLVEIKAIVNRNVDTSGFQLAINGALLPFPNVVVPADREILLFLGQSGTSTAGIFFPTAPPLGANGTLAIFSSTQVQDPSALIDFVSWNSGGTHIDTAVVAGRWSSQFDSLPGGLAEGATHAFRGQVGELGPRGFYVDTTPTLGSPNDPGMTWASRAGCAPLASPGILLAVTSSFDPGPWIGEPHTIFVQSRRTTPEILWMAFGFRNIGLITLDPIGLPTCSVESTFDVVVLLGNSSAAHVFPVQYTIGPDPALVGTRYWMQAIASGVQGSSPLGVDLSRSLELLIGSR